MNESVVPDFRIERVAAESVKAERAGCDRRGAVAVVVIIDVVPAEFEFGDQGGRNEPLVLGGDVLRNHRHDGVRTESILRSIRIGVVDVVAEIHRVFVGGAVIEARKAGVFADRVVLNQGHEIVRGAGMGIPPVG